MNKSVFLNTCKKWGEALMLLPRASTPISTQQTYQPLLVLGGQSSPDTEETLGNLQFGSALSMTLDETDS